MRNEEMKDFSHHHRHLIYSKKATGVVDVIRTCKVVMVLLSYNLPATYMQVEGQLGT